MEVEMFRRTPAATRVSVPPSRAGPARRIYLSIAMLALSVDATAGAQEVKAPGAQLVAAVNRHVGEAHGSFELEEVILDAAEDG